MTARRALRWGAVGFTATVLGALGSGCELIAGTRQREFIQGGASGDASASANGSSSASEDGSANGNAASAGATSGSAGGGGGGDGDGGGGTGGTAPNPWPDSATPFCAIDAMAAQCSETANSPFFRQDGDFSIHPPSYMISGSDADRTITDTVTTLVWQGNFSLIIGKDLAWDNAKNSCAERTAAGNSDWRLPTRRELASLLDTGHATAGLGGGLAPIFPAPFDPLIADAQSENVFYWVDAEAQDNDNNAWTIKLVPFNGTVSRVAKSAPNGRTLCVRGTTAYQQPTLIAEEQVVRDAITGLVWQRDMTPLMETWTDALLYCDKLSLGGMTGFRLPTVKELLYLVDDTQVSPALDHAAFPSAPTATFWSSTPYVGSPVKVFTVDFAFGEASSADYQNVRAVRCVR